MKTKDQTVRVLAQQLRVLSFRGRVSEKTKEDALNYLDRKLLEKERGGKVVTILTSNEINQRIACYGQRIAGGRIFSVLNLSTGSLVAYPSWSRLCRWSRGLFVPLSAFTGEATNQWVALVGIEISLDSDIEAISFS